MCRGRDRKDKEDSVVTAVAPEQSPWTEMTGALDDVWELADKTVGRLGNVMSVYGDRFQQRLDEATSEIDRELPDLFQGSDHKRWRHQHEGSRFGWRSRKDRMWAYPAPSAKQYAKCKDQDGVSAWSRDGVWRCLLPNAESDYYKLPQDFGKVAVSTTKDAEKKLDKAEWFTEYSVYLDWVRAMRKAESSRLQADMQRLRATAATPPPERASLSTPRSAAPTDLRYVSEVDAEKQGKRVISSSVVIERVSGDDGALQTKKLTKKWYDDNTVSVSEERSSGKSDAGTSGGWFWR